jgi:hypothetical protein
VTYKINRESIIWWSTLKRRLKKNKARWSSHAARIKVCEVYLVLCGYCGCDVTGASPCMLHVFPTKKKKTSSHMRYTNFRPEQANYAISRNASRPSCSLHYSVTPWMAFRISCLYSKLPSITLIPVGRRLIFLSLIHFFLAYVKAHSVAKIILRQMMVQLIYYGLKNYNETIVT